jgi:hypothetical protein
MNPSVSLWACGASPSNSFKELMRALVSAESSPTAREAYHRPFANEQRRRARGRFTRSSAAKDRFERMTGHAHDWPGHVLDHVIPLAYGGSIVPPTLKHRFGPCGAVSAPSGRVELGLQLIPHRVGVWISRMVRGEQGPSFMSAISGQAKRGAGGGVLLRVPHARPNMLPPRRCRGEPIAFDAEKAECSAASPVIS